MTPWVLGQAAEGSDAAALAGEVISVSGAFEGSEEIAEARDLARSILTEVKAVHGLPVSGRVMGVWDSNPTPPAIRAADAGRVGQHGLEIVLAVCTSFAVHREPVGKRVAASVVPADDPGGAATGRPAL